MEDNLQSTEKVSVNGFDMSFDVVRLARATKAAAVVGVKP